MKAEEFRSHLSAYFRLISNAAHGLWMRSIRGRMNRNDEPMKACALIISEDRSVRWALARVLEDANFLVLSAHDEEEGLDLLNATTVDLVILDDNEGDNCSSQATHKLKNFRKSIPVIVLKNRIEEAGFGHSAEAFIFKPVDIINLAGTATRLARVKLGH